MVYNLAKYHVYIFTKEIILRKGGWGGGCLYDQAKSKKRLLLDNLSNASSMINQNLFGLKWGKMNKYLHL